MSLRLCSCDQSKRRSFISLTYRMFEVIEKAQRITEVDALIEGCNEFLLARTLLKATSNVFGEFLAPFLGVHDVISR